MSTCQGLNLACARVQHLAQRQRDHAGLTRAALRLRDHVAPAGDWQNRALLNRAGLLKAIGVEPAEEVLADSHGVEG